MVEGASMRSASTYDLSKSVIKVAEDLFKIEILALNHWLIEVTFVFSVI